MFQSFLFTLCRQRVLPFAQGPLDLLNTQNLPAVGILLTIIGVFYWLFSKKVIRWGADVDALLAEKDKRLAEKDRQINQCAADCEKWQNTAFDAANRLRQMVETNRDAVQTTAEVVETLARKKKPQQRGATESTDDHT